MIAVWGDGTDPVRLGLSGAGRLLEDGAMMGPVRREAQQLLELRVLLGALLSGFVEDEFWGGLVGHGRWERVCGAAVRASRAVAWRIGDFMVGSGWDWREQYRGGRAGER